MKNDKMVYAIDMTCDNPSADRFVGIFTGDKVASVKKYFADLQADDDKSDNPYYGKIVLDISAYKVNDINL